jgi:hypothetical protein
LQALAYTQAISVAVLNERKSFDELERKVWLARGSRSSVVEPRNIGVRECSKDVSFTGEAR